MPTTPSLLLFRKTVHLGLTAQAINFAQSAFMGHRVSFTMPVDFMNEYFRWERAAGELRPTGRFVANPAAPSAGGPVGMPIFSTLLERAFESAYTDIDGVAEGLNYSSPALDSTNDMKRDTSITNKKYVYGSTGADGTHIPQSTHYSVNDLVMAFVLSKCFGSSAYDTWDVVYNLEDAFGMLSNSQLAAAIEASLTAEETLAAAAVLPAKGLTAQNPGDDKGRVDEMFRSLLSIDPQRFYLNGKQIPGLFETNTDVDGSGNWCLGVGDKIEIPVRLYFRAPVTVLSVVDNVKNPSSATPDEVETTFIRGEGTIDPVNGPSFDPATATAAELAAAAKNGNMMSLRLQLLCSEPAMVSNVTRATSEVSGAAAPAVAVAINPIFYDGANYQNQKAIAVVYANLGSTADWAIPAATAAALNAIVGLSHSFANGVLELTYAPSVALSVPAVNEVDVSIEYVGATPALPAVAPTPPAGKTIKITISAPPA